MIEVERPTSRAQTFDDERHARMRVRCMLLLGYFRIQVTLCFLLPHLVVWIPPKYAVSAVMGYLKGKLAIRLLQKYERLGKQFWGRHIWGRGYCVSTIGIDEQRIREYVQWQEKKEQEIEKLQGKLFDEN